MLQSTGHYHHLHAIHHLPSRDGDLPLTGHYIASKHYHVQVTAYPLQATIFRLTSIIYRPPLFTGNYVAPKHYYLYTIFKLPSMIY